MQTIHPRSTIRKRSYGPASTVYPWKGWWRWLNYYRYDTEKEHDRGMVAREYGGVSGSIGRKRWFLVFPDRCGRHDAYRVFVYNKMIQSNIMRNCIRFLLSSRSFRKNWERSFLDGGKMRKDIKGDYKIWMSPDILYGFINSLYY